MVGSGYHFGEWDDKSSGVGSGITGTAPLCVFSADLKASIVLSPFSNFMAASQAWDKGAGTLSYGVMGDVGTVPAGYKVETVLSLGSGVAPAMIAWGDKLLAAYGKRRAAAWERDMTLRYLGYSTDNGAYYYYHTEAKRNYEEEIVAIWREAARYPRRNPVIALSLIHI